MEQTLASKWINEMRQNMTMVQNTNEHPRGNLRRLPDGRIIVSCAQGLSGRMMSVERKEPIAMTAREIMRTSIMSCGK